MKKLIIKNLEHCYEQNKIYKSITYNFSVEPTRPIAIIGKSGSGKTSLLNLITGFTTIQAGSILYNGQDISNDQVTKRPISYLMQNHMLFNHLNLMDNMILGNSKASHNILKIATHLEIADLLSSYPNQISTGQRQRACLIQVILQQRPIVLLDEPFAGLDYYMKCKCIELIKQYCNNYLIITTHDLDDITLLDATPYYLQ